MQNWIDHPGIVIYSLFSIWMLVDSIRRKEYFWMVLILAGIGSIWYFINVYSGSTSPTRGFELPGSHNRKRIKELQAQIHHLDKAHHYYQLGDIYFQQGKLVLAESAYRAALEREPSDIDARAHMGQCLLRLNRAQEAKPLLESVIAENPKHDYGFSMMAFAESLIALGENQRAIEILKRVTENHSYPRAKVQLAELYESEGETALAQTELKDVIADDSHAPAFQRRKDKIWVRRARSLSAKIGIKT